MLSNLVAWSLLVGLHNQPHCGDAIGGWSLRDGGVMLGPAVGLLAFNTVAFPASSWLAFYAFHFSYAGPGVTTVARGMKTLPAFIVIG
eukprot:gene15991-20829_t